MAVARRVIYIGTNDGAFEVVGNGDVFESRELGLRGMGDVRAIVVDARDPDRLYAGTAIHGVRRSIDGGRTWHDANEGLTYKNIYAMTQHPVTGELWVGTEPANLFKSENGADSWIDFPTLRRLPETKGWFFPSPPHIAHIRHVAVRPDDPNDVFGAVEDGYLVRSQDGGASWRCVKNGVDEDAHSVFFMPDDPNVLVATTGRSAYRSTDNGETFVRSDTGLDRAYMAQLAVHPDRPNVLFTAASQNPPPAWRRSDGADLAAYRSDDQGVTWRRLEGGLRPFEAAGSWSVAGDPADPDVFLVGLFNGEVWATLDGGESFATIAKFDGPVRNITVARRG